jgi:hypothetical protein
MPRDRTSAANSPVDLPRFRGGLRAWDQGIWSDDAVFLVGRILLFGPWRSHSSAPARTMMRPSRAVTVKDGPGLGPPAGLVLDGREHGGRLVCVGTRRMVALVLDRRKIPER